MLKRIPGRFSKQLGIYLETAKDQELFKWFLASILFGARISEVIVINTYHRFDKQNINSPRTIIDTGWDSLVQMLDEGGYVRYDFKTATKLLDITSHLEKEYKGDLNNLHTKAVSPEDLERLLQDFKGIGPVTVNIFLRELRGVWEKAKPFPGDLALQAALDLGLVDKEGVIDRKKSFSKLQKCWREAKIKGKEFSDFETALVRLGKNYCRKNREECPMKEYHINTVNS